MKDHEGDVRGFYWTRKAWYSKSMTEDKKREIMFGFYAPGGGTSGEMCMRWHDLGGHWVPRIEVFRDAWDALYQFGDILRELAERDNQNITEEDFVEILKGCGFEDQTPYEDPTGDFNKQTNRCPACGKPTI